jgi:hypothetical protein
MLRKTIKKCFQSYGQQILFDLFLMLALENELNGDKFIIVAKFISHPYINYDKRRVHTPFLRFILHLLPFTEANATPET